MRKSLTKLMVMSIIISLASCSKKIETYSLRDWLIKVDEELELEDVVEESGFYHITQEDRAYQAINNLVAWGVLDTTVNIDLDSDLTREWVAYTLVRMDGSALDAISVKDGNESKFPREIAKCVALGMMELDKRACFNPRKVVSKEEADALLAMLIERINHREFEGYEEVAYTQEASNSILVHWVDKERGIVENDERVEVGDLVQIWEEEEVYFYKVIGRNEEGLWVEVPLYEEVIDELEVEDTFMLDFSQVEVLDEDQTISIEELSSYTPNEDIVLCGMHKSGSKEINGFKIKYSLSGSSANVKINKKLEDGAEFYGDMTLSNIQPTFKWKSKGNSISDAYFSVSFKSVEDIGLSEGQYQHYYGDFSQIDGKDFLNSLSHVFQEKKAGVKTIIPICTIKVPLPHAPVVKLVMQLVVKIGATGRIELGLVNEHLVGLEIRNGQLRTFHEHGHDLDFIIKATAESGLGTLIGMEAMNYRLADVRVDAGISTTVKTMAHLYDDKGEKVSVGSELPLSVVDVLSVGKEEVKFCGDLSGNWTLDLVFNDSASLASKAGFYREFEVFDEDNAPLFKNSQLHLEDGLFVDKCTRSNKNKSLITELPVTYKIQLQDYAFSIKKGESKHIVIKGLPKDVLLKDLVFSSLDNSVAKVDSAGVVTGMESGNTVILICSRDGKYETQLSVMVKWNDRTGNS